MANEGYRVDIYQLDLDWRAECWRTAAGFWPSERTYVEVCWAGQYNTREAAASVAGEHLARHG